MQQDLLFLFYLPIVSRLVFFFLNDDCFGVRRLNRFVGRLELHFGWMRDWFMIPFSLFVFGRRLDVWFHFGLRGAMPFDFAQGMPTELIFLGLSIYARFWRWHGLIPLQELARKNPRVHPTEFFNHLYGRLGFLPHPVPEKARQVIDPRHLDFRKGRRPKKSFLILLRGVYDTFLFATLAYKCFKWKGARYIQTAGSGLSIVWASRLAQDARMEVIVEGPPHLDPIDDGRWIYAVNHKSFFDFCLAPLAYRRENKDGSAASFIPSIMVAKDHFKDNFFLYRIVGFGRMLEAWGMIFVDRKSKEASKAKQAVQATVQKILSSRMPFSIYPQGTRAWGQLDRDGSRWDAGYFCVGKKERLKKEGGHFKKGVGYIAVETALGLLKHKFDGKVWIVPVAMSGPGSACPKKSLRVQTETTIHIKLGEPICIDPNELKGFKDLTYAEVSGHPDYQRKALECCETIDRSLQQLLNVSKRLERRFFMDLRGMMDARAIDEMAIGMKPFRGEEVSVYMILDCIYALPKKHWRHLLLELANVLRNPDSAVNLITLREKVAGYF